MYSKKYLIAKKTFSTKESSQCFYRTVIPAQVILIDLVYRKDENFYPKVFLKNVIHFYDSNDSNDSNEKFLQMKLECRKLNV